MVSEDFELKYLQYGHPGKLILGIKGAFNIEKMSQPIILGQMPCNCWAVLDGNNRIGLILKKNQDETIKLIPRDKIVFFSAGQWDYETFSWWNPYPKPFHFVLHYSKIINKIIRNKKTYKSNDKYNSELYSYLCILNEEKHICSNAMSK